MTTAKRDPRRFPPLHNPAQQQDEPENSLEGLPQDIPSGSGAQMDDDTFLAAASTINKDVRSKAEAWINKKNASLEEVTCILYKQKPEGGMKQCGQWKNLIPDEHNIGLAHGKGKYTLYAEFPKTKDHPAGFNRWDFELDEIYDTYKREAQLAGNVPLISAKPQTALQTAQNAGNGDTLAIIQTLIPLLRPPQESLSQTMQATMLMYQMMNDVMKKSLMANAQFFAEMQEQLLDMRENTIPDEGETPVMPTLPPPEQKKSFIEQIMPIAIPILEKFLSGNPAEKAATVSMVEAIPAVKDMITDPKHKDDCKQLIGYLDKKLKPEKTDEILKALKVDRGMYT